MYHFATATSLVQQYNCTNNTIVLSFQWTKSFWSCSWSQKNFTCLELERDPAIWVLAPQPWLQQALVTKVWSLYATYSHSGSLFTFYNIEYDSVSTNKLRRFGQP